MPKYYLLTTLFLAICALALAAQTPSRQARFITFDEARTVVESLEEILPAGLKDLPEETQAARWPAWVMAQNAAVRARLRQGDEDSMVNFLLFGVTFTEQPRLTERGIAGMQSGQRQEEFNRIINARIDDLIKSLASPGNDERLLFLRKLVADKGQKLNDAAGRAELRLYLIRNMLRVLRENESYEKTLAAARSQGNAGELFIEQSKLYSERGLSLDTTLAPNFAIEESLKAMKERGLIEAGSVRRVAVVGPGLDFTDKVSGYDFYPEQTIQPFAVMDSLLRLGLAKSKEIELTAFDISPRVLDHLTRARQGGQRRTAYTVQLPHDPQVKWNPALVKYWEGFGDQTGKPAKPAAVPEALSDLQLRAVSFDPEVVLRITPVNLNVVYQRMVRPQNFDLVVATNILVYYDVFEQSLAIANIQSMLRPGGFLLSNNALLELPGIGMKSDGYHSVVYSDRQDDGDHLVWYRRVQDR
jgi:hypothetical protein